jgi:hypothetical protein
MLRGCAFVLVACAAFGCGGSSECEVPPGERVLLAMTPTENGPESLWLIDLSGGHFGCRTELRTVTELGSQAWRPDGLAAAQIDSSAIAMFDLSGPTPLGRSASAVGYPIEFTAAGGWALWFVHGTPSGMLQGVRADDATTTVVTLATLDPGAVDWQLPVSAPASDRIALGVKDGVRVYDLDASGGPTSQDWLAAGAGVPGVPSWSGDGRWLEASFHDVNTIPKGSYLFDTSDPASTPSNIGTFDDWLPGGALVLAETPQGTTIYDLTSGTPTATLTVPGVSNARWVDAAHFVAQGPTSTLFLVDATTGAERSLSSDASDWGLTPHKDAVLLVQSNAWIVAPVDGSPSFPIPECGNPLFAPDGVHLACTNSNGVVIFDISTQVVRDVYDPALTEPPGYMYWSPDSKLLWLSTATTNLSAANALIDPIAGSFELMPDPPATDEHPAWQPLAH